MVMEEVKVVVEEVKGVMKGSHDLRSMAAKSLLVNVFKIQSTFVNMSSGELGPKSMYTSKTIEILAKLVGAASI